MIIGIECKKIVLQELNDIKREITDIRKRRDRIEKAILNMNTVTDVVSGGIGGTQHFKVEGIMQEDYLRKKYSLEKRNLILKKKEAELEELENKAYEFINNIAKSEIRTIFRLYYVDDLTWNQVAHRMNHLYPYREYTEDSCRKKHERYLKNLKNDRMRP